MSLPILEDVRIASPCTVSWEDMAGTARTRHCGECDRDVFNLSAMTREEAQTFLAAQTSRTCVRLYKRFDGTVLTEDCPVGFSKVRRAVRRRAMLAATFVLGVFGVSAAVAAASKAKQCGIDDGTAFDSPLLQQIVALVKGQPTPPPQMMMLGELVMPAPTATPAPATTP